MKRMLCQRCETDRTPFISHFYHIWRALHREVPTSRHNHNSGCCANYSSISQYSNLVILLASLRFENSSPHKFLASSYPLFYFARIEVMSTSCLNLAMSRRPENNINSHANNGILLHHLQTRVN